MNDIKKSWKERFLDRMARKGESNLSPENGIVKQSFDFLPNNYVMKELYDADNLVVGRFKHVSAEVTEWGPVDKKTTQKYIFEPIDIDGEVRYQEVFTGFVAKGAVEYFNLPYVIDIEGLTDVLPSYKGSQIPRLGMLLTLDEVNSKKSEKSNAAVKIKTSKK